MCSGYILVNLFKRKVPVLKFSESAFSSYPNDITKPLKTKKNETPHGPNDSQFIVPLKLK